MANRPLVIERHRARQAFRLQATRNRHTARKAVRACDMPDSDMALLVAARIPAEAYRFDHELD